MSASDIRPAWQTPLQWPEVAGSRSVDRRRALQTMGVLKAAIVAALLALTVLDRFGLRLGDLYSAHPALLATYGLVMLMLLAGAAELNVRGAVLYAAVAGVAALSYLVNASFGASQYVSIGSWLLLMVLYAPFVVSLRQGAAPASLWPWMMKAYMGFALLVAAAGIAQFLAQFVFRAPWLFDYTPLIPASIRGFEVWKGVHPIGEWIKSNGFFLREPSFFSLQMGFALLVELSLARRRWVMGVLVLGLALSYSGSGLLVLAVGLLFPLGRYSLVRFAAAAALAASAVFLFSDALNLSYTAGRVAEFGSARSSAYCRFVEPAVVTFRDLDANGWTSLLGHGPGALPKMHGTCQTTFAKVPFEYGLLGTLALGMLVLGALGRSSVPVRIRAGLGALWATQANLLGAEWVLLAYMLCAMWPEGSAARPAPKR